MTAGSSDRRRGLNWSHLSRSERGSGTMLMVGVMIVVLVVSLAGVCIAGYLVVIHRARSAADLAALSGATAYAAGGNACGAARSSARANGATVTSCSQVGDQVDFVVTVEAEVRVRLKVAGLPTKIKARAYAGSVEGAS